LQFFEFPAGVFELVVVSAEWFEVVFSGGPSVGPGLSVVEV
jgi:hypothetical protein